MHTMPDTMHIGIPKVENDHRGQGVQRVHHGEANSGGRRHARAAKRGRLSVPLTDPGSAASGKWQCQLDDLPLLQP